MFAKDNTAKAEIKALSPLLGDQKNELPYIIPAENYLNTFSAHLGEKLSDNNSLPETHTPYEVPADYFEIFSSRMTALIHSMDVEEELTTLSPILSKISRKLPYQAPPERLVVSDIMPTDMISQKKQPAVISLFTSHVVRYAVAASVLFAALTFVIKNITADKKNESVNVPTPVSEQQFNQLLASADEKEIIRYLQEEGLQLNQSEIETMVDPSTLPDEIDYFDEEFSDEFFEEIQSDLNNSPL